MHYIAAGSLVTLTALFISGCGGQENTCVDEAAKQYPIVTTRKQIVSDTWSSNFRKEPVSKCFEDAQDLICPELIIEDDGRLTRLCEFSAIKSGEFNGIEPRRWDALCNQIGKIDWTRQSMIVVYASSRNYYSPPYGWDFGRILTYIFEIIEVENEISIEYRIEWANAGPHFGVEGPLNPYIEGSMHAMLIPKPCKPISFKKIVRAPVESVVH